MNPWEKIDVARAPDGGELILYQRDHEFVIRIDGRELMSSHAHGSEEAMAELACARLAQAEAPRVLIGGLGLGYTLAAALRLLPATARVLVAELVPAVVEWNRGPLANLAGRPLDDPRVEVKVLDVADVLRATRQRYDAILFDVDNGPVALTRKANQILYSDLGIKRVKSTLRTGGVFSVWSAAPDTIFAERLRRLGFTNVVTHDVHSRGVAGGPKHTIFVALAPEATRIR
jgi:spermidine synthase